MFCPNCNNEVADGTLVCNTCGAPVARIEQEHKVAAAKEAVGNSVKKWFLSPLFIVIASIVSLLALFDVIATIVGLADFTFTSVIFGLVFNMIPAIFLIIATVAVWKIVASRKAPIDGANIKKVAKYFGVMRGMQIVYVVLTAILGTFFIMLGMLAITGEGAVILDILEFFMELLIDVDGIKDIADLPPVYFTLTSAVELLADFGEGDFAMVGLSVFVVAFLMFVRINFAAAYGNARNHLNKLADCASGNADPAALQVKPPFMRMFILAGADLLLLIIPNAMLEYYTNCFASFFVSATIIILDIALLVVTGVMFILVRKQATAAVEQLNKETLVLNDIIAQMQPAYQQPMYQQPAYQQPAYQQPQQPMYQQPAYQQPAYQQPQQPMYQQPQQPMYQQQPPQQ